MIATDLRVEPFGRLMLTGLLCRHSYVEETYDIVRAIGRQWDIYMAKRVAPPWTPKSWRFGVTQRMADGDTEIDYFCGAPPPQPFEVVPGFVDMDIPALRWAVVPFDGHITAFRGFVQMVFGSLLPGAGLCPAPDAPGVPEFVERYGFGFDPLTGKGGFDLMVPIGS